MRIYETQLHKAKFKRKTENGSVQRDYRMKEEKEKYYSTLISFSFSCLFWYPFQASYFSTLQLSLLPL